MIKRAYIKTIEEALAFVQEHRLVSVLAPKGVQLPALWDAVDLPEKQPGEKGWGAKVGAVWTWKNALPARWPDAVFYGKIKGGHAVLMTLAYLRDVHFPAAYQPLAQLKPLCRHLYEHIRQEPYLTGPLRKIIMEERGVSKSQFETALKQLQISLNVVRSPDPEAEGDTWLTFKEVYSAIWEAHVGI